jgi:tyrosinase
MARDRLWGVTGLECRYAFQTIRFSTKCFSDDQHCEEGFIVHKLDRRDFMIGAGGLALAGAASPAKVFAQAAAPPRLAVRRAVGTMQPNDPALISYFRAVERMKQLPPSDPRNWNRIAQIHVDFCPHGNWFFLPWHRAYLVSFERICRQVLNDPNFALPYWDWTQQRQMPPVFTSPTLGNGRRNALFDGTRRMRPAATFPASDVGPQVISRIMAETIFENFGSTRPNGQNSTDTRRWLRAQGRATSLEFGPHNMVHSRIDGDMGQMISPRDPIFWLHHCNIDRLWAQWNALGRRNTTNRLWTAFQFDGIFQTPQGQGLTAWNVGVTDVLDHRAFGYTYSDLPDVIARPRADTVEAAEVADLPEPHVLASETATGSVSLNGVLSTQMILTGTAPGAESRSDTPVQIPDSGEDAARKIRDVNDVLRGDTPAGAGPRPAGNGGPGGRPVANHEATTSLPDGRVFSILENIKAAKGNATIVNVFLNHPNPTADTPEDDPHFIGRFGLFGLESHAAHEGMSVQLELTETVARLRQANRLLGRQLDLQVVPVEASGGELELNFGPRSIVTLF